MASQYGSWEEMSEQQVCTTASTKDVTWPMGQGLATSCQVEGTQEPELGATKDPDATLPYITRQPAFNTSSLLEVKGCRISIHIFQFCKFGLKARIHAPKLGRSGDLTP